jgi:glyceraldehyde 3-phosphate dehydrogenase
MRTKVAVNGLGRIGRAVLRAVIDDSSFESVAVNDLTDVANLVYLLRFDTVHGRYSKSVSIEAGDLVVTNRKLGKLQIREPLDLPWKALGIELVCECTGAFTLRAELEKHIRAGARFVLLSDPTRSEDVETVIHRVNAPGGVPVIISCASCTTNCNTPIVEIIGRRIGIEKAMMTTMHADTSSQSLVDAPSKHLRRGRAAAANLVPTTTGAALATTRALPQYAGRFDGIAIRAPIPIPVASLADLTCVTARERDRRRSTPDDDGGSKHGSLCRRTGVSSDPLVSSDVIGDPRASIIDRALTTVVAGDLVKVMSWYDNEWGYAHQMVREATSVVRGAKSAGRSGTRQ